MTAPLVVLNNSELSGLSQLLNLFGGGGLKKASLFAVGISPYITAQIIVQLLSNDLVKKLSEYRKMGEVGKHKLELCTRLLTLPFAVMTSLGALHLLSNENVKFINLWTNAETGDFMSLPIIQRILMVLLFVSGTYVTLFLSDLISKRGIGNGITLIIMSGIISGMPENFITSYDYLSKDATVVDAHKTFIAIFKFIIYLFFYLLILILIVFINGSVRKIPLQQTGSGMILQKDKLSYLPIKLMPAGIMPVVFAGSTMILPVGIAELIKPYAPEFAEFVNAYLSFVSPIGLCIYFMLVVVFSFLYSQIMLNVEEMSRNFQKSGWFIPGVMIGQQTYNYINNVLNKINCFGAPFLAFVAVMPNLLNMITGMPSNIAFGGTGIIIMVSGALQIYEEVKSNYIVSKYKLKSESTTSNFENLKTTSGSENLIW